MPVCRFDELVSPVELIRPGSRQGRAERQAAHQDDSRLQDGRDVKFEADVYRPETVEARPVVVWIQEAGFGGAAKVP